MDYNRRTLLGDGRSSLMSAVGANAEAIAAAAHYRRHTCG
jgi:hypothetical protein